MRLKSYSFRRSLHRVVASPALGRGVPSSEGQLLQPCLMNCMNCMLAPAKSRKNGLRRSRSRSLWRDPGFSGVPGVVGMDPRRVQLALPGSPIRRDHCAGLRRQPMPRRSVSAPHELPHSPASSSSCRRRSDVLRLASTVSSDTGTRIFAKCKHLWHERLFEQACAQPQQRRLKQLQCQEPGR